MTAEIIPIDTAKLKSKKDYALAYASIGWKVLPLWWIDKPGHCACGKCSPDSNSRGKHPINATGQHGSSTDQNIIKSWWKQYPEANIGIYLAGSKLVAVDIDPRNGGMESIEDLENRYGKIESDVLQFTGGGGEHRVFHIPEGLQTLPAQLGSGIDLKLNGYIVVEPSGHFSGGSYGWEASSNPLDGISPSPLPDWIRDLSIAKPIDQHSTEVISRFVIQEQIEELRSALMFIDADDRDTWIRTGTALKTIGAAGWKLWYEYSQRSAKFNHKDQLRVWRSFKPTSLNIETIYFMARTAGWVWISTNSDIDFSELITKQNNKKIKKDYPIDFPVPILNELMLWMETAEELPSRMISMQGVLAAVAVLAGRIYKSENNNDSSLYLMTLAETGRGKSFPAKAIKNLFNVAGVGSLIKGSGNTSASAVFSALRESPCHLQISDEIGKQYKAARNQHNGQLAQAFTQLTNAYSECDSIMYPLNFSTEGLTKTQIADRGNRFIINPSITLYSFATPEQVFNTLTSDDIDDGFLNRQIIVNADDELLPERERQSIIPPQHLVDWVKEMRRISTPPTPDSNMVGIDTAHDQFPAPVQVAIPKAVRELFKDFNRESRAQTGNRLKMAIRWNENAMRMATGMAVAENQKYPVISISIAKWCIDYVRFHGERLFVLAEQNIADNEVHRLRNQVLKAVDNKKEDGIKESQLHMFCRMWKGATLTQRDQAIESLVRDELIIKTNVEKKTSKGRSVKSALLVSTQFFQILDE